MRGRAHLLTLLAVVTALLACACSAGSSSASIRNERARWNVELVNWVAAVDGTVTASIRVSGPPSTSLETLSFRFTLRDAANEPVGAVWRTVDLSQVPRGAPKELTHRFVPEIEFEGLSVELVLDPTPEEAEHVVELHGLE
jgi:hypothetical protein